MANLLQLFAHRCSKWVASCGRWDVGGLQAPVISGCTASKQVSKYWFVSATKQGQINWIKLSILIIN